jgi:PAS domain S-box-containing protein
MHKRRISGSARRSISLVPKIQAEPVSRANESEANTMRQRNRRSGTLQNEQRSKKKRASPQIPFDVQMLLDVIPFYVMLVDEEHEILFTNKALRSDLGLDPEKIIGGYCPEVVHGMDEPYPGCPLEEALESGKSVEREFFNSETGRWVSSAVYPTGKKTQEGREIFVHFISDITERKEAEEEVRRNYHIQNVINTILRLSLENIPLEEVLDRTLDLILSVSWLAIESKGCIFIVEDEPGVLVMKSQRGLPRPNQMLRNS